MAGGRPSIYSDVIADSICDELIAGRSILKITADKGFPGETTIYRWLDSNEEFRAKYARARELQADHYAAECIDLADTPVVAEKRTIKADGGEEVVIGDAVERTRLQIDSRKWYASKLNPKKYGDKIGLTGPDGVGPIQLVSSIPRPPKE